MRVRKSPFTVSLALWSALVLPAPGAAREKRQPAEAHGPAILWTNPSDIRSRDLFDGPGGSGHAPRGPFTFVKEDMDGTNPKFVVTDRDGTKWKVKLGNEARPETVASRIVWAVGYRANADYFVAELHVSGLPARLRRGQNLVEAGGTVRNARLKRETEGDRKVGTWRWRHDAFTGTRELNGLRTLMAVLNNWDLKDENNAVYQEDGRRIYMVSDLGASFGCAGRCWPRERSKGDVGKYSRSVFIRRVTHDTVSFQTPARPRFLYMVNPKEYVRRIRLEWIGRDIPRADARWMGRWLARLSAQQVHDAFRAAGYSQPEIERFSAVFERRVASLTDL